MGQVSGVCQTRDVGRAAGHHAGISIQINYMQKAIIFGAPTKVDMFQPQPLKPSKKTYGSSISKPTNILNSKIHCITRLWGHFIISMLLFARCSSLAFEGRV